MPVLKKIKPDIFYGLGVDFRSHLRKTEESEFIKSYGGKIITTKNYTKYLHSTDIRKRVVKHNLDNLLT